MFGADDFWETKNFDFQELYKREYGKGGEKCSAASRTEIAPSDQSPAASRTEIAPEVSKMAPKAPLQVRHIPQIEHEEPPTCGERAKQEVWMPLTSLPLSVFLHGLWNFLLMYPLETCAILVENGPDIDGDRVARRRLEL